MPSGIAVEATYGSLNLTDIRRWTLARNEIRTFDGKEVAEIEVVCTFVSQLAGNASAADRATDLAALIADLEAQNQAFLLEQDGTTLLSLDPATNTNEGPKIAYSIPDQSDPFKFGYNVPVTVTVTARVDPQGAGPILARSEEIDKQVNVKGYLTIVTRGELKTVRGSSAEGQLATVRPAVPAGFDQAESITIDANDLRMTYQFTQVEREEDPPGDAGAGSTWNVAATCDGDGRETWVMGGRLVYVNKKKPTETDIDNLVKKSFPSDAVIVNRSVTRGFDDSSLSFTVTATRAWGKQKFLSFQQTVRVRVVRSRRYFQTVDPSGKDERQDFAKPVVEITQTGSAIGQGAYPAFPEFIQSESDVDEVSEELGPLVIDPTTGKVAEAPISWSYRGRQLNKIDAGKIARFKEVLDDPKTLEDKQSKAKGQKCKAKVA